MRFACVWELVNGLVASETESAGGVLDPPFGLFSSVFVKKHGG